MKALPFSTILAIRVCAVRDIEMERDYQIKQKDCQTTRDDTYTDNQLIRAACSYALHATNEAQGGCEQTHATIMGVWPWPEGSFSKCDKRSSLVKAAALLVAEIERIDRANQLEKASDDAE